MSYWKILTLILLLLPAQSIKAQEQTETVFESYHSRIKTIQENPEAKLHLPIYPASYPENYSQLIEENDRIQFKEGNSPWLTMRLSPLEEFNQAFTALENTPDYQTSTMTIDNWSVHIFEDYGNTGYGEDFDRLNETLDLNRAVLVGANNIHTLFGHYYDLTGTGVFNPLDDQGLLDIGTEVVLTDKQGISRGYEITQKIEFLHPDQADQYYGAHNMPMLAYYGNESDMLYIQYCRWDISLGLLITYIGYRIW